MNALRRNFVGGNWKSNGTLASIKELLDGTINKLAFDPAKVDVVIAPTALHLGYVKDNLTHKDVHISAQNASLTGYGAFTGEISSLAIKDYGLNYVILGHSERRSLYGESDEVVADKTKVALDNGLKVIFCIGELLEEREAGKTMEVVTRQMAAVKDKVANWDDMVIAYEPVWAIGTGKVATPDQAQEVHHNLRNWASANISADVASKLRIIYGGSVNDGNCEELIKNEDVDGFLVGGAALKPAFHKIVESCSQ